MMELLPMLNVPSGLCPGFDSAKMPTSNVPCTIMAAGADVGEMVEVSMSVERHLFDDVRSA